MSKTALVTGATGQIGSYLCEYLAEKGYRVVGTVRRTSSPNMERLSKCPPIEIEEIDLCDPSSMNWLFAKYQPDLCFNTAAQSHVGTSFNQPTYTFQATAMGVLNCLEAMRHFSPNTRFLQMSTSEMFGDNYDSRFICTNVTYNNNDHPITGGFYEKYQNEETPFKPRSPYAVAKLAAHYLVHTYRESYGLFSCSSINFNTESPRRGENFVTRKITKWIGKEWGILTSKDMQSLIKELPKLKLGNINSYRDWTHAKDTVDGLYKIINYDKPEDFVLSSNETHSVKDFLSEAFGVINKYFNMNEKWEDWVEIDPSLYRPAEVEYLRGDSTKARTLLGWEPKITFPELVKEMVWSDIDE